MRVTLCILRHGHATGQGPSAGLLPGGIDYVTRLGRRLAREGLKPAAAFSSPYVRAHDTARIVLGELACDARLTLVPELTPDTGPDEALGALTALGLPAGPVLVVSHLPLVGALVHHLADRELSFPPGAYAEVELAPDGAGGTFRRYIGPDELARP